MSLKALAPLLEIPGITFVNLQAGPTGDALKGPNVLDVRTEMTNRADLAACIAELDLVIAPDHPAIHLAGALGVPGRIVSPYLAMDWRWFPGDNPCPFYASLQTVHQTRHGQWASVVGPIARELSGMVNGQVVGSAGRAAE